MRERINLPEIKTIVDKSSRQSIKPLESESKILKRLEISRWVKDLDKFSVRLFGREEEELSVEVYEGE